MFLHSYEKKIGRTCLGASFSIHPSYKEAGLALKKTLKMRAFVFNKKINHRAKVGHFFACLEIWGPGSNLCLDPPVFFFILYNICFSICIYIHTHTLKYPCNNHLIIINRLYESNFTPTNRLQNALETHTRTSIVHLISIQLFKFCIILNA